MQEEGFLAGAEEPRTSGIDPHFSCVCEERRLGKDVAELQDLEEREEAGRTLHEVWEQRQTARSSGKGRQHLGRSVDPSLLHLSRRRVMRTPSFVLSVSTVAAICCRKHRSVTGGLNGCGRIVAESQTRDPKSCSRSRCGGRRSQNNDRGLLVDCRNRRSC